MTNFIGAVFLRTNMRKECWVYTGGRDDCGYGVFYYADKKFKAHRIAYEACYGKIPAGLQVCHHCDNPPCINPRHLFLGTAKDNNWDHWRKARPNKNLKLSKRKVRNIRKLIAAEIPRKTIAERYGVSYETIMAIAKGKVWSHVK